MKIPKVKINHFKVREFFGLGSFLEKGYCEDGRTWTVRVFLDKHIFIIVPISKGEKA